MELADGLLLQVNNGEQWYNRWKRPNDDSVRIKNPPAFINLADLKLCPRQRIQLIQDIRAIFFFF